MKIISKEELYGINGGAITGTFMNAITKGMNTFLAVGRAFGSSIRRLVDGSMCPL